MTLTPFPKHAQNSDPSTCSANQASRITALEEEAHRHYESGHYRQAILALQQLINLAPENIPARFNLGLLYQSHGEFDKAIACYQDVCAAAPGHFQMHFQLGNALKAQNRSEEAIASFEKALQLKPTHVDTLHSLGTVYFTQDRIHAALDCFQRALSLDPTCSPAHYNLGLAYFHQGKLHDAVTCYLKAAECDPDDGDTCYNLGLTYRALGLPIEAISWYQKAARISPDDPDIYFNLGSIFKDLNEISDAIKSFEKCISLSPNSGAALSNLGMLYHMQDQTDMAITCYKSALESGYEIDTVKHMLASLTGENMESASARYVTDLFDNYAERFDHCLLGDLEYQVPDLLRQLIEDSLPNEDLSFQNVLDLGAGTGLAGLVFQTMAHCLTGVDLSGKMIAKAHEKTIYAHLHVAEVIDFLKETEEKYDLLIAADVFTYMGNLKPFFSQVKRCLLPGSMLVFSTESHTGAEYHLKPSGRYGHAAAYIRILAEDNGWKIIKQLKAELRKDKGHWIHGNLYLLKYSPVQ